ncbi:MAG: S8 family serine peptidase [Actinobacteria bacterium]|nr:S8 family serine peptidase [Actinomycetota bacterium]
MLWKSIIIHMIFALIVILGSDSIGRSEDVRKDGKAFTTMIFLKFKLKVIELDTDKSIATLSDIPQNFSDIRNYFSKFGNIQFEQVFKGTKYGDTQRSSLRGDIVTVPELSQHFRVIFPEAVEMWKTIREIRNLSEVESADPPGLAISHLTPNDLHKEGNQWYLTKINAENAWDITTGSTNIKVAVIDVGVNRYHSDLVDKCEGGEWTMSGDHGTMVAGVIGAKTDNKRGIASLGWNVKIMPYDYDDSDWNAEDVEADIKAAADAGAQIINCSWAWLEPYEYDDTKYVHADHWRIRDAVQYAQNLGCLVVSSYGNTASPVTWPNNGPTRAPLYPDAYPPHLQFPACYPNVIGVTATNSSDQFPSGYNYGSSVDVCAPGINILTTSGSTYSTASGTSLSSPLVCALAGLLLSMNPNLTTAQVASTIYLSACDLGSSGWDQYYGHGRIDAAKAVRYLYVPQVYPTISAAVDGAVDGQTILIDDGTYIEDIAISKNITLEANGAVHIRGNTQVSNASATFKWLYLEPGSLFGKSLGVYNGTATLHSCYLVEGTYTGSWGIYSNNSTLKLRYGTVTSGGTSIMLINPGSSTYIWDCSSIDPGTGIGLWGTVDGEAKRNNFFTYTNDTGWDISAQLASSGVFEIDSNNYGTSQEILDSEPYNVYGDGWPPGSLAKRFISFNNTGSAETDERLGEADSLVAVGKFSEGIDILKAIVDEKPESDDALFSLHKIVSYGNEKDLDENSIVQANDNKDYLNQIIQKYPDGHPLRLAAEEYNIHNEVRLGNVDDAISMSYKFNEKHPDLEYGKRVLFSIADIYTYVKHDEKSAKEVYALFVQKYPDHPMSEYAKSVSDESPSSAVTSQQTEIELANYPNPFNPETTVQYTLPEAGRVILKIYDVRGQEVATLVNEDQSAGAHSAIWNGRGQLGIDAATGMYFYRIFFQGRILTGKALLVR